MKNKIAVLTLSTFWLVNLNTAFAASEADVDNTFYPYKAGVPKVDGLNPGIIIDKSNLAKFSDYLDFGTQYAIKKDWYQLEVGKTVSFDPHPKFLEATLTNLNKSKLGTENGVIEGYEGGLPFPEKPSVNDPRAGEKLAWNFRYNYGAGDGSSYAPFYYKFRNMNTNKTERTIKFGYYVQKHKYRVAKEPIPEITPNPSKLFRSFYIKVTEPQDLEDTQLLIQRYTDDTKRDDAYLYLGFQRRVRRLATDQTADPFLGTDLMIEDFEGYNARISDSSWKFLGEKVMLMPMYNHSEVKLTDEHQTTNDGYKYVAPTGTGQCFLANTWQLRKVYIVEGSPVNNEAHPVGKRTYYIDAQTFTIPKVDIYDRKGELWKIWTIGIAHPDKHLPINKGSYIPLFDGFSMVDVQTKHCTFGMIKGQAIQPPQKIFNVQNMRGGAN